MGKSTSNTDKTPRKRGRKRVAQDSDSNLDPMVTVDMENVNKENSSDDNDQRSKKRKNKRNPHGRTRVYVEEDSTEQSQTSENENIIDETVRFEEDENLVEVQVRVNEDDFLSEEMDEGEEGEVVSDEEEMDITFNSRNNNATVRSVVSRPKAIETMSKRMREETVTEVPPEFAEPQSEEKTKAKESMEEKIDNLSRNLLVMQKLMFQKGIFDEEKTGKIKRAMQQQEQSNINENRESNVVRNQVATSGSVTTVYDNTLQFVQEGKELDTIPVIEKRVSSSSDEAEQIDTSAEMLMDVDETDKFISECMQAAKQGRAEEPQPGTSGYKPPGQEKRISRSDQMVKEAEASKARMFATPGKMNNLTNVMNAMNPTAGNAINWPELSSDIMISTLVDEEYLIIGSHIDETMQRKILNNEYIDFAKLLPRDRLVQEEDHRMELVNKGGLTFFMPVADRESGAINSFAKWEQAFRVFSNVYTRKYPHKASELIQYNHLINMAALNFAWDNVYLYDKEFRIHMSKFPQRSWGVILQQAWMIRLKDRVRHDYGNSPNPSGENRRAKIREPCRRFNRGKCTYGHKCKYEHKCSVPACGKFGHGAHICRKRGNTQGNSPNVKQTSNVESFNSDKEK